MTDRFKQLMAQYSAETANGSAMRRVTEEMCRNCNLPMPREDDGPAPQGKVKAQMPAIADITDTDRRMVQEQAKRLWHIYPHLSIGTTEE